MRAVAGGKDFMIKKEFRWGGERPLHLRGNLKVSNFNWEVLKYKELPRNLRPLATTERGLQSSQTDRQIHPRR